MSRGLAAAVAGAVGLTASAASAAVASDAATRGRELFEKVWVPFDPESAPGGDGLGPYYNDTSCVACHDRGGIGGAGAFEKNAVLGQAAPDEPFLLQHRYAVLDLPLSPPPFRTAQRNPTALFGAGVLDAIADSAIAEAAYGRDRAHVERVGGRIAWTADGRVGRFGWKGQIASLEASVANSCAVEMGLEVAGHSDEPREPVPRLAYDFARRLAMNAAGFKPLAGDQPDLGEADLGALVAFVAELPRPRELGDERLEAHGERLLHEVGCDDCHTVDLAGVQGLYSDLLLHDLGGGLAEGGLAARGTGSGAEHATPSEWRTPPLWGLSASGPYLHDGRAATVEEAILAHEGQARDSVGRYASLSDQDRVRLNSFLAALPAP